MQTCYGEHIGLHLENYGDTETDIDDWRARTTGEDFLDLQTGDVITITPFLYGSETLIEYLEVAMDMMYAL